MEYHNAPSYSTPSNFQDFDNVVTSLQNLDLDNVVSYNQESSSRNHDHGAFDGSRHSSFSPQLQYVDWSNNVHRPQVQYVDWKNTTVHRPQVLDQTSHWGRHGSAGNSFLSWLGGVCVCVFMHIHVFVLCVFLLVFEIFL